MRQEVTIKVDVSTSSYTNSVDILGAPMSIQPVTENIIGNPTYTLEVSSDGVNFLSYTRSSTKVDVSKALEITHGDIPWKFLRMLVEPGGVSSGSIYFVVTQGNV